MDFFAVATLGSFATPTPTDSSRAVLFCSWGLLTTAGSGAVSCKAVFLKLLRAICCR